MIKTQGVYHIGIPVDDKDRAVKFYTEVLGMTVAKTGTDDMAGRSPLRKQHRRTLQTAQTAPGDGVERDGATHQAFTVSPELAQNQELD